MYVVFRCFVFFFYFIFRQFIVYCLFFCLFFVCFYTIFIFIYHTDWAICGTRTVRAKADKANFDVVYCAHKISRFIYISILCSPFEKIKCSMLFIICMQSFGLFCDDKCFPFVIETVLWLLCLFIITHFRSPPIWFRNSDWNMTTIENYLWSTEAMWRKNCILFGLTQFLYSAPQFVWKNRSFFLNFSLFSLHLP